jgi:MOSC domain-containing protein YiiM
LREDRTRIGDRLVIGSTEFEVTQPRALLAMKFGTNSLAKRMLESQGTRDYLRVIREGSLEAGDTFKVLKEERNSPTMAETVLSSEDLK